MSRVDIKKLLPIFALLVLFSYSNLMAWCIAGRGTTCIAKQENQGAGIQLNFGGGNNADGAESRKVEGGDKSKNQGYADYKRWAVGMMVSVYAVPHQDGNQYTGVDGLSVFFEHNISEFFTIGVTHIDQKFSHLEEEFQEDDIRHKHTAAYIGLRTWITNRSVIRVNVGMADSEVSYLDENLNGSTEFMSVGYEYALDDSDSSRIGYRYISLAGQDNSKTRNIGMSAHGITFQVLF